jgi:metallophosphoesterase (TIGR00282 family)
MIRVLAIGDIMGKPGRRCIQELLPLAQKEFSPDVVIANGENLAGGFGITKKVFDELTKKHGVDCITTGNHWHDKRDVYEFAGTTPNFLRPANMYNVEDPTFGLAVLKSRTGVSYAVINLYGRAFMKGENRCPFKTVDQLLPKIPASVKAIIVDVHAETSSEKQALAHYLASRVSVLYGTHTHCPTADERIIGGRLGFVTDVGMTGPYDSVIGIRKEASIERLTTGVRKNFEPATRDLWMCFIVCDIEISTGKCIAITRLRWELDRIMPGASKE